MTTDWRPLSTSDLPSWADLLTRVEAVDRRGENFSPADLGQQLADPRIDLPAASVAIHDAGRMIGFGLIRFRAAGLGSVVADLDGAVDPDHRRRGLGRRIVDWFRSRATATAAGDFPERDLELRSRASDRNTGHAALLVASGFRPVHRLLDLERDLREPVTVVPAPAGMLVSGFGVVPDNAVLAARNDAFAGHWGSAELGPREWARFLGAPAFRPDLSYVMHEDGTTHVTGMLLASYYEADTVATGLREVWVHDVGTRRAARGTGVAESLLTHALDAYRRAGFARASLSVGSDDPAAPLTGREEAGFVVAHRWIVYGDG